jgi:glycerol-3-phosphate acyltransferase PlsY
MRIYGRKEAKNAGLTNTLRCYGKGPALVTLIGDLSKGIISVLLSILVFRFSLAIPLTAGLSDT